MAFHRIDMEQWERRDVFEYFRDSTMYFTVQMDITGLLERVKESGMRLYPTLIYCVSSVVNQCPDYRHGYDGEGNMGIWDVVHPIYTVPRKDNDRLFAMTVTEYQTDFHQFYRTFLKDYTAAEHSGKLVNWDASRQDLMGITAVPGLHFSAFSFGGSGEKRDCTPFTVIGRYVRQGKRVLLPVSCEFTHAVNDGYHISRFFEVLQTQFDLVEPGEGNGPVQEC